MQCLYVRHSSSPLSLFILILLMEEMKTPCTYENPSPPSGKERKGSSETRPLESSSYHYKRVRTSVITTIRHSEARPSSPHGQNPTPSRSLEQDLPLLSF